MRYINLNAQPNPFIPNQIFMALIPPFRQKRIIVCMPFGLINLLLLNEKRVFMLILKGDLWLYDVMTDYFPPFLFIGNSAAVTPPQASDRIQLLLLPVFVFPAPQSYLFFP